MDNKAKRFAKKCSSELKNEISAANNADTYKSLDLCIIDCVYSLRAKYESVTRPLVKKYADKYLGGKLKSTSGTTSSLIKNIKEIGTNGFSDFLENHQKLGGKASIPKSEVCLKLAEYLNCLGIETVENFNKFTYPELLEAVISSVKGLGNAGTNYLFMLAGDENRCKPDVHIKNYVKTVFPNENFSDDDYQTLFRKTVEILKKEKCYSNITVRKLDHSIWNHMQNN